MEKDFDADEKKDKLIIKELLQKSSDYKDFATKLTEYFSKKYGSEFGGNVLFTYDMAEDALTMTCFDQDRIFELCDDEEIFDIATQLKFLRKTATHSYKQ